MIRASFRRLARRAGFARRAALPLALSLLVAVPLAAPLAAQTEGAATGEPRGAGAPGYWRSVLLGALSSLALHEAGHVGTALALGARPTFGFDRGRPTIFSGISSRTEPHKQLLFSSAGLSVQALADEMILDVPHRRGAAFERGVLAGGIGTALFYVTIGRTGSVSDIDFMTRTSSLSKTQISLLVGGVALLHGVRVAHDGRYAHFFARPRAEGGMRLGVQID